MAYKSFYCRRCNLWLLQQQMTVNRCPYCGQEYEAALDVKSALLPKKIIKEIIERDLKHDRTN